MPVSNVRVPASCIGAAGDAAIEERLALAQHDGNDRHDHLVEQPLVGELDATLPPPTTHRSRSPAASIISS